MLLNTFAREGEEVSRLCRSAGCDVSIAAVSSLEWNDDLTPWPAPPLSRREAPCRGLAREYLALLAGDILPRAAAALPAPPERTVVAGYSLAGLFALWSACSCGLFDGAMSASGSMWYPDFADYVRANGLSPRVGAVYLSLGDAESRTRHPLLRTVRERTQEIYGVIRDSGVPAVLEWNEGNHFTDAALRTAKGIARVAAMLEDPQPGSR